MPAGGSSPWRARVADPSRRWEGDERGAGVGDGEIFRSGVDALSRTMAEPRWVAEDPDVHLLPHIRRACQASGRLRVVDTRVEGPLYAVTLEWTARDGRRRGLREDVFTLIGAFAELSTHVQERPVDLAVEFDVTTGMLAGETGFASHGHVVRLRVVGEPVRRALG